MTISRLTVDKLGMKLYDKVSAVIAELIANSYDADATEVKVYAPMGEYLATKNQGQLIDKGHSIVVEDNGIGMTPEEVNEFYLVVGAERRADEKRGDTSGIYKRKVMGRKGVGKLAPFGVCQKVEIITSGGERANGNDENNKSTKGYRTAHLFLERSEILTDTHNPYFPSVGPQDGIIKQNRGTLIRLTIFDRRRVPDINDFGRQLARRFGVESPCWSVKLIDSLKTQEDDAHSRVVGEFSVEKMDNTEILLGEDHETNGTSNYLAKGPDSKKMDDMRAGFEYEGKFYPVTGWVAYSKHPYKDDLMAGVRIYCRGKIAAQTSIFNMKAGFTGEYDIRSYLIGELHADWLDESEDLIQTDRQDILWSHELGQEFEKWGQKLVKIIGNITRQPKRKKAWELFEERSNIQDRINKAFPSEMQSQLRENTTNIAMSIAQTSREDELQDQEYVESIISLSLLMGPHITLDKKLREAAESKEDPLSVITGILKTARIAELASFGRIADDRIRVIKRIELLKDDPATIESAFQSLISEAPWLINPQWAPITSNQSFSSLKSAFKIFYKSRTGEDLELENFTQLTKRPDFVLSSQDNAIQIIEIKRPDHSLKNGEMDRIITYVDLMRDFLDKAGNEDFKRLYPEFHVTLVCDSISSLTGAQKAAFNGYTNDKTLNYITWEVFLLRTRKMHENFLKEAERQKQDAAKE